MAIHAPPLARFRLFRRWRAVLVAAVVGVVVVGVGTAALLVDHGPGPGRSAAGGAEGLAPDLRLEEVREGRPPVSLADHRGKPVVLNFWASWCEPCAREMPAFERVHRRLGDRVAFAGIDNTDSRRNALAQLQAAGVTYPSGYDPTGATAASYRLVGMPTTIFVGRDGRVVGRHAGELSERDLEGLLRRFFEHEAAP